MIEKSNILHAAEAHLAGSDLFVIEVKIAPGNDIEVVIDSDNRVDIDQCAALSRVIEASLDREAEDFSLTVYSAGIGSALVTERQFRRLTGKELDLLYKNGQKQVATLTAYRPEGLDIEYQVREIPEGKKRKETVTKQAHVPFGELKSASEHLDIK